MTKGLEKLLQYLEVERIDKYLFIGTSPSRPRRVFGGQVLAQALNAAARTVDGSRIAHSMHAYFLRPGDPSKQIVYEVDPIRDGRSFTTRRVVAKQDGVAIFNTSVSLMEPEDGLSHQVDMPDVPMPEELESDRDYWRRVAGDSPPKYAPGFGDAIDRYTINRRDYENPQPDEPVQHFWFRANGEVGDEVIRHQTLVAFISDFGLLGAALRPHPYTGASSGVQIASLDHAIWFHRPLRADDYLLYTQDSPSATAGRGFSRGSFYTTDGVLVASTAQESLLRERR